MFNNDSSVTRIKKIKFTNIKNVKFGEINLESDGDSGIYNTENVIGIYGQNGSGKSAFVEVMKIVDDLLQGKAITRNLSNVIHVDENKCSIEVEFAISFGNELDTKLFYNCSYFVEFTRTSWLVEKNIFSDNDIYEKDELPSVVLNKEVFNYNDKTPSRAYINYDIENYSETFVDENLRQFFENSYKEQVEIRFLKNKSLLECRSFIFSHALVNSVSNYILNNFDTNKESHNFEWCLFASSLINKIKIYSFTKLNVLDESDISDATEFPFFIKLDDEVKSYNKIKLNNSFDGTRLKASEVNKLKASVEQVNIVLSTIIKDLYLTVKEVNSYTSSKKDVEDEFDIKIYSLRDNTTIDLMNESQGIRKFISLLNLLIQVYNDESVCLVIDEFDSAIFEYLLGELLYVFKNEAKGQLIFTSHNLRPLEVLDSNSVVFTTTNPENRYIKFKDTEQTKNFRDMYYEVIKFGGQDEEVYNLSKTYAIRRAFEEAGDLNE